MKGDFTRETFKPSKRYWGVLRQQGRVDLDADWNEQVRIGRYHHITRTADLIGPAGGPADGAGFEISVKNGSVLISSGRYYVAGILCENDSDIDLEKQADNPREKPPTDGGLHLAYLDVWDRHVTALDDPQIRETALGGPDTANRVRTVWQVKIQLLAESSPELVAAVAAFSAARRSDDPAAEAAAFQQIREMANISYCDAPLEPLGGSLEVGTGTLAARVRAAGGGTKDPCRFEPGSGYRRQENRLYRVEIHSPGTEADATYKWSRDNGSIVVSIEEFLVNNPGDLTAKRVRVRRLGFDSVQALKRDDWVEIVGDDDELAGLPGMLAKVVNQPDPLDRILELSEPVNVRDLGLHPKVRRWDMLVGVGLMKVKRVWTKLEDGVEIKFASGTFNTGDYWLIPARTNTADIEWPPYPSYPGEVVTGAPMQLPPMGVERYRAPLAVLVHDGSEIVAAIDLRRLFPAATDQTLLFYAGGDGQEPVLPDGNLPQPLQVAAANGSRPVGGVLVKFEVVSGGGELDAGAGFNAAPVTVPTGSDGVALVSWRLDTTQPNHRVRAQLLDRCEDPIHTPVFFNSHVNYQLHYLSGDGQEGMPGETLEPLRVWVSNGHWPVKGARVEFSVELGNGRLDPVALTNTDGMTQCTWTLDTDNPRQQVKARLLNAGGVPVHEASICFNASLSTASQVSYDPSECPNFNDITTVQEAVDALCKLKVGESCCVAVGAGTAYGTIGEAIKDLIIEQGNNDVCICLKPGFYKEKKIEVAVPNLRLKIVGSGKTTRVRMEGPWLFNNLPFIHIKDMELASIGLDSSLQFIACRDVHLTSCGIDGLFEKNALVSMEKASRIRIHNCHMVAEKSDARKKILEIFDRLLEAEAPPATLKVRNAVLALYKRADRFEFEARSFKTAKIMTKLDNSEQARLLSLSKQVLKSAEQERFLEPAELSLFHDLVNLMIQKTKDGEFLIANRLNDIRIFAAASSDMTAIALHDGFADTEISNSRIFGNVGLYGLADPPALDGADVKILQGEMRKRKVDFPNHNGRLYFSGNSFRRFWLSNDMYKRLKAVVEGKEADFSDSFSGLIASDNTFRANRSWLFSRFLTVISSDFDMEIRDPSDLVMATAVNENAIYTANRGPDASALDALVLIRNLGFVDSVSEPNMMLTIDR